MKVLITGGGGQLGTSLQRYLQDMKYTVIAPTHDKMDVTNEAQVRAFFRENRPDAVVHCASYNFVDLAEKQVEKCRKINVYGTGVISTLCKEAGAFLLYISSDYVFDGEKQGEYLTTDDKKPISVYGKSKSDAEDIVLRADATNAVLRTSWLFGPSKRNFVESILTADKLKSQIRVVDDQIGSPTFTEDLSVLIEQMIRQRNAGIYHGTNEGECTWAKFAAEILRLSGSCTRVIPISSAEYASAAKRPLNSKLNKTCLDENGLSRLPTWQNALERYMNMRSSVDERKS